MQSYSHDSKRFGGECNPAYMGASENWGRLAASRAPRIISSH
jgi:hypothetical protein